ncbi:hypothetical protein QBC39DRAFT_329300 [Podospora conica]|nr:hypothetical protein QBC39DRAFT_329300 [Schizothecium conicum]
MQRIAGLAVAAPVAPAMVLGATEAAEAVRDSWRMRKGRELEEFGFLNGRAVWLFAVLGPQVHLQTSVIRWMETPLSLRMKIDHGGTRQKHRGSSDPFPERRHAQSSTNGASQNVERSEFNLASGHSLHPDLSSPSSDGDGGGRWTASWMHSDISANARRLLGPVPGGRQDVSTKSSSQTQVCSTLCFKRRSWREN